MCMRRKWQAGHYSCLENPMDRGAWQATVHRVAKSKTRRGSWTTAMIYTHTHTQTDMYMGFPDSSVGKESACNAGHISSIPESGRSTGEGIGYPLQDSCLENSMDYTGSICVCMCVCFGVTVKMAILVFIQVQVKDWKGVGDSCVWKHHLDYSASESSWRSLGVILGLHA